MYVYASMMLGKTVLMSTRLVVMVEVASINVLDVPSLEGVTWFL